MYCVFDSDETEIKHFSNIANLMRSNAYKTMHGHLAFFIVKP